MRVTRSLRWLLLALLVSIVPAKSFAGVFISVGFAPPVLPVYVQPVCPEPGLMWMPGYWAYGEDGYYWVPGAWVPAPYTGALWTPGYWGWSNGLYVFHDGYWGPHVGYYGGVNYGFGYMGVGFVGGAWRGGVFAYNTAVMRVDTVRIHNVYVDRTIVERNTIVNDRHVAYAGGPGGIQHQPAPEERIAMNERHIGPTSFQQQHVQQFRADKTAYFKANQGRPQNVALARPLAQENHPAPVGGARPGAGNGFNNRPNAVQPGNRPAAPEYRQTPSAGYQNRPNNVQPPRTETQRPNYTQPPRGETQRPNNVQPQHEERPHGEPKPQKEKEPRR